MSMKKILSRASLIICVCAALAGCATYDSYSTALALRGTHGTATSVIDSADATVAYAGKVATDFMTIAPATLAILDADTYTKTVYIDQPTRAGAIEQAYRPAKAKPYRPKACSACKCPCKAKCQPKPKCQCKPTCQSKCMLDQRRREASAKACSQ